jgi:hypothetical protein
MPGRRDKSGQQAINGGFNDYVRIITCMGPELYVGGWFTNVGGISDADYLVRWNGSAWQAVNGGLNNIIQTIRAIGPDLYVGGRFLDAGGDPSGDYITRLGTPRFELHLPLVIKP